MDTEFAPDGDPIDELDNERPSVSDKNKCKEQRSVNEAPRLRLDKGLRPKPVTRAGRRRAYGKKAGSSHSDEESDTKVVASKTKRDLEDKVDNGGEHTKDSPVSMAAGPVAGKPL